MIYRVSHTHIVFDVGPDVAYFPFKPFLTFAFPSKELYIRGFTKFGIKEQSCSVSKETTDVTVTRGMLWSDKVHIITLALLHKFVYEFRGNNTYRISSYSFRP